MAKVFYCKKCVFPSTKPHLKFNEQGVCSACTGAVAKKRHNWRAAELNFKSLADAAKSKKAKYDCVIPVSGGKDSIYQVVKAKQYGMKILAVNVDYGIKTKEGIHNLSIITKKLGVDVMTFTPGNYHKSLIRTGFLDYGDPDMFSHALLYTYPTDIAESMNIPVVLFGENPAVEYIGDSRVDSKVDGNWFFTNVMSSSYWSDFCEKRTKRKTDDWSYMLSTNVLSNYVMTKYNRIYFLGNYFYWDSQKHAKIAESLGFKTPEYVPGTYRNWVGIDEVIHRVHQYIKVIKFGYGRATDHACEDVREGKIDRQEAIRLASFDENDLPNSIIREFCDYIEISDAKFRYTMDKFRNPNFWKINMEQNEWYLDRDFNVYYERI